MKRLWAAGTAMLWISVSTGIAAAAPLRNVSFLPQWQPQAQFAGYYVAYAKGFYANRNIDVTILRGGSEQPPTELLAERRTDFTTMFLSTAVERRSKGLPCVNLAQIIQRSALLLVARRSSGIASPADFAGKKVSVWPEFQTQCEALFRKYEVQPHTLFQGPTINLFLRGGVDVASAMWYNEYHLLISAGVDVDELTVFRFDELGLNFPEDGIYCLESTFAKDPGLCRDFVQASIEGWEYAFDHSEEALEIVMARVKAVNQATNRVHQRWMLRSMRDLIMPSGDPSPVGLLKEADYRNTATGLLNNRVIATIPDFASFHENCIAEAH
ncbi:MAG: ABC transporter substrate-binding protein [Acidobacteriota bacterium]